MPTLSAGSMTLLRTHAHAFVEYLAVLRPGTILACQLNGAPSGDPVTQITYDNVTQGAFGDVVANMTLWVGSVAGGRDKGSCRIRKVPTSTILYIAEDSSIDWDDDDHLTVVENYELWMKYPRIIADGDLTIYKDWDVAYSDQHENWAPVAIMGPPDCQFIDPDTGLATCQFVGEFSYTVAPGASISSYAWSFPGGTPPSSASAGTEAAPVEVTWDTAGTYWVTLTVTDSNGKTHTGRRPVFIFPRTGAGAPYNYFKMTGRRGDLNQHGHSAAFQVHGDADQAEFPDRALVVYFSEDWYGATKQSIGGYCGREHIHFAGYIQRESTTKDPQSSTVTFDAATINALMDSREGFSAWIKNKGSADNWCEATSLTADRAALSLCRYNSTLLDICDVTVSGDTEYIKSQEFAAKTSLMQQLQTLYDDLFAHVACDKQGRLYFEKDPQMISVADRGSIAIVCDLGHGDWRDRLDLPRPQEAKTSFINLAGVHYAGHPQEVEPVLSKAPGDAPAYMGAPIEISGLILAGQADGNEKAGLAIARENNEFPDVPLPMPGLWDVFDIVPQEYVRLSLAAEDTKRGIVWTNQKLIPRQIELIVDETKAGRVPRVTIHVEKDSFGPPGVTGDYPVEPPSTPVNPPTPPPPILPPGGYTGNAGPVVAAHDEDGCFWSDFMGESWEARNTALESTAILDLIWDPWWFTEYRSGGRDPDDVILWACGEGFVAKNQGAGYPWEDRTPTTDPPNSWADTTPPTAATVTYKQIHGDICNLDTFYLLVEWQEPDSGNGLWRGWLAKTIDNGLTWTWSTLTSTYYYHYASAHVSFTPPTSLTDPENGLGTVDGQYADFKNKSDAVYGYWVLDIGYTLPQAPDRGEWYGYGYTSPSEHWWNSRIYISPNGVDWTDLGNTGQDYAPPIWNYRTYTGEVVPRYIRIGVNPGSNVLALNRGILVDSVRLRTAGDDVTTSLRPLAIDLDTDDGSRLYITLWREGNLCVQQRSASDLSSVVAQAWFGAATAAQVADRTYFIVPRCPHILGGSGFGEYLWIFGRWNDGGIKQLAYSENGGVSYTNKGSAGWDSNHRIAAIEVLFDGLAVYAFVNHASTPRLWHSPDQAVTWSDINTLPFNVEFESLTRCNWAADEFFVARNGPGAMMAAWLESPYTGSWTDGTGDPSLPTASGAISAIIWVG